MKIINLVEQQNTHDKRTMLTLSTIIVVGWLILTAFMLTGCSGPASVIECEGHRMSNEHTPIAQYVYYENDTTILIVAHYVDGIDSIHINSQ